jgi:hypothetical protein
MTRAFIRAAALLLLAGASLAPAAVLAQEKQATAPGLQLSPSADSTDLLGPSIAVPSATQLGGEQAAPAQSSVPNVSATQALNQLTTNSNSSDPLNAAVQNANQGISQAASGNSAGTPQSNTKTTAPPASADTSAPKLLDDPLGWLLYQIVTMFAGLVTIAGIALNVSAYWTIVKMGYLVGQLSALQLAWGVFRDLGNIAILFGFIAAGITMILDAGNYGSRKMIVTLVIVAVAINFSSLAARAVIDAGNIVALQFYKPFAGGTIPSGVPTDNGISNALMDSVKLTTIYHNSNFTGQYLFVGLLSIILFIAVAFVFFALAFLFVSRFIILIFLITVSPLAFAGYVIPRFRSKSDEWLSKLINNTLVAPVALLLLLISTKIVTSGTFTNIMGGGWDSFAASPGAAGSGANILIVFMIACGFYLASLIAAKNLSSFGGQMATKVGGALTFGAVGFAGRNTIGRASYGLSQGLRKTWVARTGAGRLAVGALDRGGKASFDARGLKTFGSLKLDAGKAPTGGYKKYEEESIKARTEYAKSLKGRSKNAEEKEAEEKARNATAAAERAATQARSESSAAKQEFDAAKAEKQARTAALEAIRAEQRQDRYWETNPQNVARLNAAQDALAASETRHAAAEQAATASAEKLASAEREFAARSGAEKVLGENIKNNTSDRAAQEEYAKNLEKGSLRSGLVFGPGAKAAAKKIRDEAKKTKSDKQLEALRKALDDAEKADGKKNEGEKKEEEKNT